MTARMCFSPEALASVSLLEVDFVHYKLGVVVRTPTRVTWSDEEKMSQPGRSWVTQQSEGRLPSCSKCPSTPRSQRGPSKTRLSSHLACVSVPLPSDSFPSATALVPKCQRINQSKTILIFGEIRKIMTA